MSDDSRPVDVTVEGGIARIALARPARRNAFDDALVEALLDAFSDLRSQNQARVVILEGQGSSFCAGADLAWMQSMATATVERNVASAARMAEMFEAIHRFPGAVIAKVHGAALGGGAGLIAAADIAVAADDAKIGFTEARLGILPAVISPYVLLRIGPGATKRWFVTGSRMGAAEALRIGLVHEVVPAAELEDAVRRIAFEVLQCGPVAVASCKELIDEVWSGVALAGSLDDGMAAVREYTAERIAAARVSAEGQEGLRAFLDKRKPKWAE